MSDALLGREKWEYCSLQQNLSASFVHTKLNPGFRLTQTVDTNSLIGWQIHHFAVKCEIISSLCSAEDSLAGRANHFDAEVKELE